MSIDACERCGYYECECVSERSQQSTRERTNELLEEILKEVKRIVELLPMTCLAKSIHDVTCKPTETWCEHGNPYRDCTEDIDQADCLACLEEARAYGKAAERRWRIVCRLQDKRCPIDSHASDCDCGGTAGDR